MDKISTKGSMIEQIDLSNVPRSGFDMSFHNYLTGRLGAIIPTQVREVLPGDRIKGSTHIVSNFEPLVAPIMGNMVQKEETFFVPYSLIWNNAHRFFTGKKGFDNEMPQVSLSDCRIALGYYLSRVINGQVSISHFVERLVDVYADIPRGGFCLGISYSAFTDWYTEVKSYMADESLYDLFNPYRARLVYYDNAFATISADDDNGTIYLFQHVDLISQFLGDCYNFFFGPSSMIDYMGVSCRDFIPIFKKLLDDEKLLKSYPISSNLESIRNIYYSAISDFFIDFKFNWMPFRAAYWVWYWNYREQLIEIDAFDPEEEMVSDNISYDEIRNCLLIRQRCWFKDAFTTALTNTGDGNIIVPTTMDDVELVTSDPVLDDTKDQNQVYQSLGTLRSIRIGDITYQVPSNYLVTDPDTSEGSAQAGISLKLLDRARRLSSWISKRLVLGTEYDDVVYSSFMVKLSNVRMHIPEILGQGRTQVAINAVVNNTTTELEPAGQKSAIAFANNEGNMSSVNYYAEEHGLLLSFMTIMPIQSYPESMQRLWFKKNRFDFAWPEFAQLGMDAVYLFELTGLYGLTTDEIVSVFGYQGRYYDYKCAQDQEHGRLHTDLNYLTFGRVWNKENGLPKLNVEFVHCWPRTDMFVVPEDGMDVFRSDVHHRYAMERCLPVPSDTLR